VDVDDLADAILLEFQFHVRPFGSPLPVVPGDAGALLV
jgi:hypothetical protein